MEPYFSRDGIRIYHADVLSSLAELPDESVQCVTTSPPYYALRDYQVEGQIGLEATPDEYISKLTEVFREVRRVMRSDATTNTINVDSWYSKRGLSSAKTQALPTRGPVDQ